MKTGSTMNFLKRAGAILMVVAIFASSCNKYADDFDQLNKKIDALATTIAGVPQLTTDIASVKATIAALQTSMAALPTATQQTAQFAAVATQLTAMTTQITAIQTTLATVATTGTATAAVVAKLATDLATLSDKVKADNATIIANQATQIAKLNAMDLKIDGLTTKMTDMAATMKLLSDAIAKVQAGVDANALGITGLTSKLADQATAIGKIASDLTALSGAQATANSAAAAAVLADVKASADLMTAQGNLALQVTALQAALSGTQADTDLAALTIKGLQLLIKAQQATLDQILANTAPTPVNFSAIVKADGTSKLFSTKNLTLTFDIEPTTLSAAQVTVVGATKGALTGTGLTRNLAITAITGADKDSVAVTLANPPGYKVTPVTRRAALVNVAPPCTFVSVAAADGVSGVISTTNLTLTFDVDPTTLALSDITLTGATKVALTGTGLTRNLNISGIIVNNGEQVTVAVASPSGFNIVPSSLKSVVYKAFTATTASITVDGVPGAITSSLLTINFTVANPDFVTGNVTLTGATKGTFTKVSSTQYTVAITPTVANGQNIIVAFTSPANYAITPAFLTIAVSVAPTPIAFTALTANGTSLIVSSTQLTLTFSSDPTTLAASDITVLGATKGALTGTGLTRTLAISAITVNDQDNVTVQLLNPVGYAIAPSQLDVKINKVPVGYGWNTMTANGTQGVAETSLLTLGFSSDVPGLLAGNFTVTGATKGVLTSLGGGSYTLAVSAVTAASIGVTLLDPVGVAVTPSVKSVVANRGGVTQAIAGVTAPVKDATGLLVSTAGTGYNAGTVTWAPALVAGKFTAATIYTATITITPATGYTFTGIAANWWTNAGGGTATNPVDSGVVTVVFSATAP